MNFSNINNKHLKNIVNEDILKYGETCALENYINQYRYTYDKRSLNFILEKMYILKVIIEENKKDE